MQYRLFVLIILTVPTGNAIGLEPHKQINEAELRLSPEPCEWYVKHSIRQGDKNVVHFEGRDYVRVEGARDLVSIIVDGMNPLDRRREAANALKPLALKLYGSSDVEALLGAWKYTNDFEFRRKVVACLYTTKDPRLLPFCAELLEYDGDNEAFWKAAGAVCLANWNVRMGVKALVGMIEDYDPNKSRTGTEISAQLTWFNRRNGWGFPEKQVLEDLRELIEAGEIDEPEAARRLREAWESWFEENKHRFPDWKPGDPLPEVEAPQEPREAPDTKPER